VTSERFPATAASVRRARQFVVAQLDGESIDVRERVILMVSEVTTNAILHARSAFVVSMGTRKDTIRIEVTDAGFGEPQVRTPGPYSTGGRGLQIVQHLADDWGVTGEGEGKSVWFTVTRTRGDQHGADRKGRWLRRALLLAKRRRFGDEPTAGEALDRLAA
jgi:anti-sigma regulatory factor (Ser/Thr protein kinase)